MPWAWGWNPTYMPQHLFIIGSLHSEKCTSLLSWVMFIIHLAQHFNSKTSLPHSDYHFSPFPSPSSFPPSLSPSLKNFPCPCLMSHHDLSSDLDHNLSPFLATCFALLVGHPRVCNPCVYHHHDCSLVLPPRRAFHRDAGHLSYHHHHLGPLLVPWASAMG